MVQDNRHDAGTEALAQTLTRFVRSAGAIDEATAESMDRELRTAIARVTLGMSPMAIATAYIEWLGHLALSPGKLALLARSTMARVMELGAYTVSALAAEPSTDTAPSTEPRMQGEGWRRWPFNVLARGHDLAKTVVREMTTGVDGVSPASERLVAFLSQQVVEALCPANFPLTNPDVIAASVAERGRNLTRGAVNLMQDIARHQRHELPAGTEEHRLGVDIAITPGKVIHENRLAELIQYDATTEQVDSEPVLIVPAWIMKYYILDLSPHNSLVKYLRDNGKTVFMISWKNPVAEDHDLGMEDYLRLGVMESLDAIGAITAAKQVHSVGYCLGGTLLAMAAALMAREGDERLKTMTTFASQIDFTEAGEICMFLGDSTLSFLDPMMREHGFLDGDNMVGAFKALRAGQQIYGPAVDRYLLGKDARLSDLMAWNTDATRLPRRMHAEYLRTCYLDNDLAEARYCVDGRPICVGDIRVPTFVLATVSDHVAPWHSVYKAVRLMQNELTFALTTAGHNAGIVSGPSHPRRRYQLALRPAGGRYTDPDTWADETPVHDGSWWPAWLDWLDERSSGRRKPPRTGAPRKGYRVLRDAPGKYVFGR